MTSSRRAGFAERRDDVFHRRLRRELHGSARKAQALRSYPHLGDCLLPRDEYRAMAAACESSGDLHQQSGFADSRITAQEQHRAAHETSAGDAVELGNLTGKTRRVVSCAGKRLKLECTALARFPPRHLRARQGRAFFDNGVPFTAGIALALPAAMHGTATLADECRFAARHAGGLTAFVADQEFGLAFRRQPRLRADINPVVATAKAREHLIGNGAHPRGDLVHAHLFPNHGRKVAASRPAFAELGYVDGDQIH